MTPTRAELVAAAGRTIPDVIADRLDILFVGINPGLRSGATGYHFTRPGNRFWRAIAEAGLVDRVLEPTAQQELLRFGIGITNLVARTTASAAELRPGSSGRASRRSRPRSDTIGRSRWPSWDLDLSAGLRCAEGVDRSPG